MKQRPLVIPLFIPQQGCPHHCIYCDQSTISGVSSPRWSLESIRRHIQSYLSWSKRQPVQVAFYGGSFTRLPEARQRFFLEAVQIFLRGGQVCSLRLSTRPDAITPDNLHLLKSLGVQTIELGAQSLTDRVLVASARGHTSSQVDEAAWWVRQTGFELGLQLMPGLPEESRQSFFQTIEKTVALRPDFVRLYPTVVLAGTALERLYRRGLYQPLSLTQAIDWCREAKVRLGRSGIPVVRTGLQPTASLGLPGRVAAGPYHPAFGQLVNSAIWYQRISPALERARQRSAHLAIYAAPEELAEIRGQRNDNIRRWQQQFQLLSISTVGSPQLRTGDFRIATR